MARLNEPTVPADTLETLRRKFLRQNRDIARTNSTQSLKIRSLENECARLLSENLQLRSEVLRLKTELEGSHAHRVADHALQIKEKMEAQLVEWGTMLASLGNEPVPKSRSPRALKKPRIQRSSIGLARVSDWRRRETMSSMQDLEAAALQEGRLPPLWEDKTYPRETLNRDEILALCSEAEESTDSPDLGPPPVSRFVDEDPVRFDLSTLTKLVGPALGDSGESSPQDSCEKPTSYPNLPSPSREIEDAKPTVQGCQVERAKETTNSITEPKAQITSPTAKAGLKRKAREEDEKEEEEEKDNARISKPPVPKGNVTKDRFEKATSGNAKPVGRLIKELPSSKKDAREKSSHAAQRKPLGVKSSNEALGSLKKPAKPPAEYKGEKSKARDKEDEPVKNQTKLKGEPTPIKIPPPSSPEPVICTDVEPESLSAEPNLAAPHSPESVGPREEMADTPPPVDISSKGETTRANRRARAAISYAEPNLRDKMRRPNTKQLFDAVAGESKQIRRMSQCQRDESPTRLPSSIKSESQPSSQTKISSDISSDVDMMASPLVQKATRNSVLEALPTSVTTDRKKGDSTVTSQDANNDAFITKPATKATNNRLGEIPAREAEVAKIIDDPDVYEFTNSPVKDDSKESSPEEENKRSNTSRPSRSRRLSSISHEDLQFGNANENAKAPGKQRGSRKRASMATVKSAKSSLEDSRGENSPAEADGVSSLDREGRGREKHASHRRKSTML
ncbi:hypothetical protein F4861DRAFT_391613 [Xylaria intraflava]|nr:hypothetical protein F4861DRAFT_391613 [Xylaria intraflava]